MDDPHPPLLYPGYKSTRRRAPRRERVQLAHPSTELTGPALWDGRVNRLDHDLTRQHDGEPLGERIIVHGRVLEDDGRPVPGTLVGATATATTGTPRRWIRTSPVSGAA